jgi:hypothetical protein
MSSKKGGQAKGDFDVKCEPVSLVAGDFYGGGGAGGSQQVFLVKIFTILFKNIKKLNLFFKLKIFNYLFFFINLRRCSTITANTAAEDTCTTGRTSRSRISPMAAFMAAKTAVAARAAGVGPA